MVDLEAHVGRPPVIGVIGKYLLIAGEIGIQFHRHDGIGDCRARQLEDMALARGVQVVVNDDLPRLITDAGRAELVIVNLIANAIKYADPDKADRYVTVGRAPGSPASIVIEDNGIGIAPGKLAAIFSNLSAPIRIATKSSARRALDVVWRSCMSQWRRWVAL